MVYSVEMKTTCAESMSRLMPETVAVLHIEKEKTTNVQGLNKTRRGPCVRQLRCS